MSVRLISQSLEHYQRDGTRVYVHMCAFSLSAQDFRSDDLLLEHSIRLLLLVTMYMTIRYLFWAVEPTDGMSEEELGSPLKTPACHSCTNSLGRKKKERSKGVGAKARAMYLIPFRSRMGGLGIRQEEGAHNR